MVALLISQNGPENLSPASALGKLPRDLTEPFGRSTGSASAVFRRGSLRSRGPVQPVRGAFGPLRFPLPFGRWLSLLGPSSTRWGLRPSSRSAYWRRSPHRGFHVPH